VKVPDTCLAFASRQDWRAWLERHHATELEAWLLLHKKKMASRALTYEEAVEEALCFGWIDGLLRSLDSEAFALRFSPRKSRSVWSETNKHRAEVLIKQGLMTPAGLAKVIEARGNGEWDAAAAREDVSALPADLAQELIRNEARGAFEECTPSVKKQYLYWLSSAKRTETRRKRIQTIVEMVAARE
jgi:uncharacterized protein YdeI (YjbR/CyaY-like superfamily)